MKSQQNRKGRFKSKEQTNTMEILKWLTMHETKLSVYVMAFLQLHVRLK